MNKQQFLFAATIILLAISSSCKNDDCKAGLDGQVAVTAFPQHHSVPIISESKPGYPDSALIKFSPPANFIITSNPADYDLVVVADSGEDHVHIHDLRCGDYFIFMTGWDVNSNERVKGGIPYNFTQTSGEIDLNVPVTED